MNQGCVRFFKKQAERSMPFEKEASLGSKVFGMCLLPLGQGCREVGAFAAF